MIINSISDLKTYIDNGDYGTENPLEEVLLAAAYNIKADHKSPNYGEDWAEFLKSINITDIISEVDDDLTEMKTVLKDYEEYDEIF